MSSSQSYSDRLTPYPNRGTLGLVDNPDHCLSILCKAQYIARRLRDAGHVVVHTGAGLSTSCGIPDFRGPQGIWTKEQSDQNVPSPKRSRKNASPDHGSTTLRSSPTLVAFENAIPSLAHAVIAELYRRKYVHYVVSQNVDGLHLKSGLPRHALSELHGNLFVNWCQQCESETNRDSEATTVGLKPTGRMCNKCGHVLTDKALDWEDQLPEPDFERAKQNSAIADLQLVVGTSCQMNPARSLPFRNSKGKQSRILINLSVTPFDDRFGTVLRAESDVVFAVIADYLNLSVPDVERTARLKLSIEYQFQKMICRVFQQWDNQWTQRSIPGVRCIRYVAPSTLALSSGEELTNPGYRQELDRNDSICVQVSIIRWGLPKSADCDKRIFKDLPLEGPEDGRFDLVTAVLSCNDHIRQLRDDISRRLQDSVNMVPRNYSTNEFFVCGKQGKRGFFVCVLCGGDVWGGKGAREQHVGVCIKNCLRKIATQEDDKQSQSVYLLKNFDKNNDFGR